MKAIEYLVQQASRRHLSATDAAMLLILSEKINIPPDLVTSLARKIDRMLRLHINDWPLFDISLCQLALHEYDSNSLKGELMALLVKRLLAAEVDIGGPYYDKMTPLATNAMIAQLFMALGTPLPRLSEYLEKIVSMPHDQSLHWSLMWPRQLVKVPYGSISTDGESKITNAAVHVSFTPGNHTAIHEKQFVSPAVMNVYHQLQTLPGDVRIVANTVWKSVTNADKNHEISMLNYTFLESCRPAYSIPKAQSTLLLDTANFYVWMAYSMYDDFLDDEGTALTLPTANIAHRRSYDLYSNWSKKAAKTVVKCYDEMDFANTWELTYCRFSIEHNRITLLHIPRYQTRTILAKRAQAHILGPVLIAKLFKNVSTDRQKSLLNGLRHYLIARQINDDLHDWKEDLQKGHGSFVVSYLLRSSGIKPGSYDIQELTDTLQVYFWKFGYSKLITILKNHINRALAQFESSHFFTPQNSFYNLTILPLAASAEKSAHLHEQHVEFLNKYQSQAITD